MRVSKEEEGNEINQNDTPGDTLSRRIVLQSGAAMVAGAAAEIIGGSSLHAAQVRGGKSSGRNSAGRRFKAWVTRGVGANNGAVEELTLRPISGRQVVVRTEAAFCCYSNAGWMLGTPPSIRDPILPMDFNQPLILGHGGVGIVEAVGADVNRVAVGDRVLVGVAPQCGQCYCCLQDRAEFCTMVAEPQIPVADLADGIPVAASLNIGGHAELMVPYQEFCVPLFTDVPSVELAPLSCPGAAGLGAALILAPFRPGADVVVFGAGVVGLSAIQGARIGSAGQIIAIEPIAYRRDLALKLGATHALDPVALGGNLVARLRELCGGRAPRRLAGGKSPGFNSVGPDRVIEAVGESVPPPREHPVPDPSGILPIQQAWEITPAYGHLTTLGAVNAPSISFPALAWGTEGRTHHASNLGGTHLLRDMPRYARLIERGDYDSKPLVTATFPLSRAREAFQAVVDRTVAGAVLTYG